MCMGKKLTYGFVKASFEKEGYTLLSKEYNHSQTKLKYKCPNGHEHFIKWNDWKTGYRCPYCAGKVKPTIEFIKSEFEKDGYTLLSKDYINSKTKLKYKCPEGHIHSISWNSWNNRDSRCPFCINNNIKLTYNFVRASFNEEGYTLLSKEYINCKTKLDYKCPEGHLHSITWNSWSRGRRCYYCNGNIKLTTEEIKKNFELEGYTLLSKKYINSQTKLKYKCTNGHIGSITWGNWQQGHRCAICKGKSKPSIKKLKALFKKEGYILLSNNYTNSDTILKYTCPKGHENITSWRNWNSGRRCPTCRDLNRFGSGNSAWKGGISFEPYCEAWKDKEYKSDIRNRDGNRCLNPYCDSKDPSDLTIHHIDYDKKNCHPSNLITVCRSCNSKANTDRTWHKYWYQAIIYRRSLVWQ